MKSAESVIYCPHSLTASGILVTEHPIPGRRLYPGKTVPMAGAGPYKWKGVVNIMDKVITISREFGSGGRELGVKLAKVLEIPFYDKELISMAADDINIAKEAFLRYDEHIVTDDPLDRNFYHAFSDIYQVPMSDQIFVAQSSVIRRLASRGPCVIVGRCADMVLEDSINIFVYAKMKKRIRRLMELESGSDEKEMERRIREVDRKRKDYYQYYTGNAWGRAQNYHLCVESGLVGVDGCLRAVMAYLKEYTSEIG